MDTDMPTGIVTWLNPNNSFGFIHPENGTKDVFVHVSEVERSRLNTLTEGQRVSFDIVHERGKQATGNLNLEPA